jgi:hypothetical protein
MWEMIRMDEERTGGCLCGVVRFKTNGRLREVIACHCSQCRRQSGHFYAATSIEDTGLAVTGGENITWYGASETARRGFCRHCGSALFWKKSHGSAVTSILAGAFDQPSGLKLGHHIFCADKADYYEINDGLPQFAGDR